MNLSLQDPFAVAKEYPESLTNTLQYGHCVTFLFSNKGDYLASGLSDGSIIIYELSTSGIIAQLTKNGHLRPVTSLSWSLCGRYLLLSSQDSRCILWDLSLVNSDQNANIRSITVDGPVWLANVCPLNPFLFVASLFDAQPIFVDVLSEDKPVISTVDPTSGDEVPDPKHLTLVSVFSNDGKYVFMGTNKGWLHVVDPTSFKQVRSLKVTNLNIKNLVISANGRKLAINSSDRIIRQINLPDFVNEAPEDWDFEVEQKYQDVVNRLQWNSVCFNHNGEFLVASTFGTQSSQDLYIWETTLGSLIKILEGSSEELLEVKWNHSRCMVGLNGLEYGTIYLWLIEFPQKWSALAPDFVEIEENIEYEEKEDEFDIIDDDVLNKRRLEEEDSYVDILTKEKYDVRGFELNTGLFVIPINYEKTSV